MTAELYPAIKAVHVFLALSSGALFAWRGVAVLLGAAAPLSRPVRLLSQAIDSALLLAALALLAVLHLDPRTAPWLLAKLGWLLAYIVCGVLALRRAPSRPAKAAAFVAALLCFGTMLSIARLRDPLGWLRLFGG